MLPTGGMMVWDKAAVIFDSNLFHRTGDIEFAPGYLTMLYGRRG